MKHKKQPSILKRDFTHCYSNIYKPANVILLLITLSGSRQSNDELVAHLCHLALIHKVGLYMKAQAQVKIPIPTRKLHLYVSIVVEHICNMQLAPKFYWLLHLHVYLTWNVNTSFQIGLSEFLGITLVLCLAQSAGIPIISTSTCVLAEKLPHTYCPDITCN